MRKKESQYGVRYSVLLALRYFDPVKFTVIDPMHNLLLGTGKHVFKVWMDLGMFTTAQLKEFESTIKEFQTPADIGRLPSRIGSEYNGFTANQWYNWITIYSPVVLKGVLPDTHLRCWLLYVRACSILNSRYITESSISSADLFLLHFCRKFEEIYGSEHCTPNMHLHHHLKDCMLNYGPLHSFWCYAFERYNGIMGAYHTNSKSIESQLMKRFCQEQEIHNLNVEVPFEISQLISSKTHRKIDNHSDTTFLMHLAQAPLDQIPTSGFAFNMDSGAIKALPPCHEKVLCADMYERITVLYHELYPTEQIVHIPYFYHECGRILFGDDIIGSTKPGPNSHSSSVIRAYWPGLAQSLIQSQSNSHERTRVGVIQFYLKHTIKVHDHASQRPGQTKEIPHLLCYVHWKCLHPHETWFGTSATVSSLDIETSSAYSFLPVQRIQCRCAFANIKVNFTTHTENVLITCPVPFKYSV